jgi:hypothetical protein
MTIYERALPFFLPMMMHEHQVNLFLTPQLKTEEEEE